MLAWITSLAAAEDFGTPDMKRRFSGWPQESPPARDLRQVAFLSDMEAGEEELPSEAMPMMGGGYESMGGGDGYCCGNGCACGGGCCGGGCGCCQSHAYCCQPHVDCCQPRSGMCYGEAQLMFLRAHVLEESLGKLSEKYEFTPRFIVGYESACGLGVRGRYWTYGRTTPNLDDDDDDLRLEFDVIDVEGTGRLSGERADLLVACGFRWVDTDIEVDDDAVGSDMPGITVAADARAWICRTCNSQWSAVAGARWSILGADWEGDDDAFIEPTFDDNVVVTELYGGFEYLCHLCYYDLFARFVFETQNWRSDALGESADTDSLGFIGPGVHVGATF
jgi:hypothetical protein